MKSVEDKSWNIFNFQIHEKSIVEDRMYKMYYWPEIGISIEKCGGQNSEYFQISNPWIKLMHPDIGILIEKCGGQNL